jgi:DNA-binding transcriptional LysR family regulator
MARENYNDLLAFLVVARERSFTKEIVRACKDPAELAQIRGLTVLGR